MMNLNRKVNKTMMNRNDNFEDLHNLKQSDIIDYFSFYDNEGNYISNVVSVDIQKDGQFGDLHIEVEVPPEIEGDEPTTEIRTLSNTEYDFTRETVFVLGVGYLIPGDIVKLHLLGHRTFEVRYGWHTNVSNQTIHSWYLVPIDYNSFTQEVVYKTDSKILTLYKEHLETIEVVEFRKNRSTFYAGGEPN